MPRQDDFTAQVELERKNAEWRREAQDHEQQQALEHQLKAKVEEIQRQQRTEHEAEVARLQHKALGQIDAFDLESLHQRQETKLTDLQAIREQEAEQARHLRGLELDADTTKLDALAEMESQPSYAPGKNEEQRKRQRDSWLAAHNGYQQALRIVRAGEQVQESLALDRHRIEDELGSIKSLIQIRIAELRLIAAFVGR